MPTAQWEIQNIWAHFFFLLLVTCQPFLSVRSAEQVHLPWGNMTIWFCDQGFVGNSFCHLVTRTWVDLCWMEIDGWAYTFHLVSSYLDGWGFPLPPCSWWLSFCLWVCRETSEAMMKEWGGGESGSCFYCAILPLQTTNHFRKVLPE